MTRSSLSLTSLLAVVSLTASHAATVSYFNTDEDGTGPDWRNAGVAKPLDADGDNIYGTDGWIRPTGHASTESNPAYLTSRWIQGGDFEDGTSLANNADGGADVTVREMFLSGGPFDAIEINVTGSADFRIGVMADYRFFSQVNGFTESTFGVGVRQTAGSGADDTGIIGVPVKNGEFDYLFFDVIGAQAGDQFIVTSALDPDWIESTLSHTFYDTIIPEPSAALLGGLGCLGLLLRRRRR